nr:hypothetical protein [Rickettsia sp. Tenjiku01]
MSCFFILVSTYYGNKVIENITNKTLTNDVFFQKCYYNDAARLTVAIVPLIMFESIKDLKFLSLATLIDVLTTVILDFNVGKAISSAGKNIAEKTATTLTWLKRLPQAQTMIQLLILILQKKYHA